MLSWYPIYGAFSGTPNILDFIIFLLLQLMYLYLCTRVPQQTMFHDGLVNSDSHNSKSTVILTNLQYHRDSHLLRRPKDHEKYITSRASYLEGVPHRGRFISRAFYFEGVLRGYKMVRKYKRLGKIVLLNRRATFREYYLLRV